MLLPISRGKGIYYCAMTWFATGGALQKTDVGGFWVHVTCAQFQPEVSISMEPDIGIRNVPLETFGKVNYFLDLLFYKLELLILR